MDGESVNIFNGYTTKLVGLKEDTEEISISKIDKNEDINIMIF